MLRANFLLFQSSVLAEKKLRLSYPSQTLVQIGVTAPVRESGDLEGSGSCKLVGPAGEIEITKGVIAAKRHIHATTADAEKMGLTNGQIVSVTIPTSNERNLTFGDVVVRVSDSYALAMHIDTDEANAAGMAPNTIGTIIK